MSVRPPPLADPRQDAHVRLHAQVPPGLPSSLGALTAPCYVHRAAQWKVSALLGLTATVVTIGLGYLVWTGRARSPDAVEIAFGLFLLLFAVLLARPSVWRAPVVAAADRHGLHFVGGRDTVLVPWRDIGPLTIERAQLNEGVGETVIVAIARESDYWRPARQSGFATVLLGDERPPGYLRVPLGTQGIDPEVTRASLEVLRRLADERPDRVGALREEGQ